MCEASGSWRQMAATSGRRPSLSKRVDILSSGRREVSAEIDAVARGLARHRGGLEVGMPVRPPLELSAARSGPDNAL